MLSLFCFYFLLLLLQLFFTKEFSLSFLLSLNRYSVAQTKVQDFDSTPRKRYLFCVHSC